MAAGTRDEERPYQKLTALQIWLLGYECPDSVLLFARNGDAASYTVYILASKKKSRSARCAPLRRCAVAPLRGARARSQNLVLARVFSRARAVELLRPLEQAPADLEAPLTVKFLERDKKNDANPEQFKTIFDNCGVSRSIASDCSDVDDACCGPNAAPRAGGGRNAARRADL